MKQILQFFIFAFLAIALSLIATYSNSNNGLPDFMRMAFPDKFVDAKDIEEEKAAEELEAPFAAEENNARPEPVVVKGQDVQLQYDPVDEQFRVNSKLDRPHKSEEFVNEWVMAAISEILTFRPVDYETHMQEISKFNSAHGQAELQEVLESADIIALMRTNNYEARSSVLSVAELQAQGVAGGRYSWLYDVPVTMTFLPVGAQSYSDLPEGSYVIEELTFRVQVSRVDTSVSEDGMVIETWKVMRR